MIFSRAHRLLPFSVLAFVLGTSAVAGAELGRDGGSELLVQTVGGSFEFARLEGGGELPQGRAHGTQVVAKCPFKIASRN